MFAASGSGDQWPGLVHYMLVFDSGLRDNELETLSYHPWIWARDYDENYRQVPEAYIPVASGKILDHSNHTFGIRNFRQNTTVG